MTFEQLKTKLKLCKTLIISAVILMVVISPGLILNRFAILHMSTARIAIGALCYVIGLAAFASIYYALHYIASHTKCLKCKKQIDLKRVLQMNIFRCPYCGNEKFDNDVAEIWFK